MTEIDPEDLGSQIDWKQFESLTKFAFESLGYKVTSNYRSKKPRIEIDILALRNRSGFSVDCKHWRRTVGSSVMESISDKQIVRSKIALKKEKLEQLVPLIVTLHDEGLKILHNGVPIVPISKLSNFALDWEADSSNILKIKSGSPRIMRLHNEDNSFL
jgi:hypothetical protein